MILYDQYCRIIVRSIGRSESRDSMLETVSVGKSWERGKRVIFSKFYVQVLQWSTADATHVMLYLCVFEYGSRVAQRSGQGRFSSLLTTKLSTIDKVPATYRTTSTTLWRSPPIQIRYRYHSKRYLLFLISYSIINHNINRTC